MKHSSLADRVDLSSIVSLLGIASLLTFVVCISRLETTSEFIDLANSFLHGRLDLMLGSVSSADVAAMHGRAYWPLGPFPAVILMPFIIAIGTTFPLGTIAFPLIVLTGCAIFQLAKYTGFILRDRLWLAFAFLFASPYVAVGWFPRGWQFSHIIVVVLMFTALCEYVSKKRNWLIGLLYAGILMTRIPAGITLVFFITDALWQNRQSFKKSAVSLMELLIAPSIAIIFLLMYNVLRFGTPFEVGYAFANLTPDLLHMRSYGVLSLVHVPGNLFYFLFAGPQPITESFGQVLIWPYLQTDKWGMGLLFSAPYFFALILKRSWDRINATLWVAVLATAIPVMMYFAIGPYQQAYRYSLDFLPMLFFIFMRSIYAKDHRLDVGFKIIIAITFVLHFCLFTGAFFGAYI